MPSPPAEIIHLLSAFAIAFTGPGFSKAQVLLLGTILAPGRRTVASALRAVGLGGDKHFGNYHRLLNRDHWSPWVLSKILLGLIIALCLSDDDPLLLVIDETLERRSGRRIGYKDWFYDAARSTAAKVSVSLGIRWLVLAIVVPVPWSQRLWALPFMAVPTPSEKTSHKLGKRHRTLIGWSEVMIGRVRRWQPERTIRTVGDSNYAALDLVHACQSLKKPVALISRLRLDAQLYDRPGAQPPGKRGPKPKKGARQPRLAQRLFDQTAQWQSLSLPWYGGSVRSLEYQTGTSLWHRSGRDPVPLRWVLIRCPEDTPEAKRFPSGALFCSDPELSAQQIIAAYLLRWSIEVTFEEIRAHLGFGTQRQWSTRAIERTTPCLFGIFSLVVLMARVRHPDQLPIRRTAWYAKPQATFSDVLAVVRRDLWSSLNYVTSPDDPDLLLFPKEMAHSLFEMACYST